MAVPEYSFQVLWNSEDEVYVATCPEFDGVSGFGPSAEDALKEAQVSLHLAIETYSQEGWPLPAPARMSEYSGQFRLRVPRKMHALLAQKASDDGVSLNTYAISLLSFGLGQSDAFASTKRWIQELFLRSPLSWIRGKTATSSSQSTPNRVPTTSANRWTNA